MDIAERTEELAEIGAGIQLSSNAGRVLAELGLDAALAEVATEPGALEVRSGLSGALLAAVTRDTLRGRYGFPYRVVHRADLQSVLRKAVQADSAIQLHLASEVAGVDQDGEGARVRARGAARPGGVSYDAVVAADGVRSALRSLIPGSAALEPASRTAWRALLPTEAARDFIRPDAVSAWLGPRAHLVCYPVARGALVNIVAIVEERSDTSGWGTPGDPAVLSARFSSWSPRLRALIGLPEGWQKFSLMKVDGQKPWVQGRLALLGDAAHAMLPFLAQGAVMAIEDAAVLAQFLGQTAEIPFALKSYEAARRKRVVRVAAAAERTGNRYHFSGPMAAARDLALRLAGERLILNEVDWIYRWQSSGE